MRNREEEKNMALIKDYAETFYTKENAYAFVGRHLIASYEGCYLKALADHDELVPVMKTAIKASGATLLKVVKHRFPSSGGLTAVFLLAESHASIHTYPEHAACFVDLFTCGTTCLPEKFDAILTAFLRPKKVYRQILLRHQSIDQDKFREV